MCVVPQVLRTLKTCKLFTASTFIWIPQSYVYEEILFYKIWACLISYACNLQSRDTCIHLKYEQIFWSTLHMCVNQTLNFTVVARGKLSFRCHYIRRLTSSKHLGNVNATTFLHLDWLQPWALFCCKMGGGHLDIKPTSSSGRCGSEVL